MMTRTLQSRSLSKAKKYSGLQLQVLSLYRNLLRTSLEKERETNGIAPSFVTLRHDCNSSTYHASTQFRKEALSISKRDIDLIEYGIRRGEKYVKLLKMGGVRGFKVT